MNADALGIVELGDVCAAMRARSLDLFEVTGAWATDGTDATDARLQRWFGEASHRHAWHAELWADRSPVIPPVDADAVVEAHRRTLDPVDDRAGHYRRRLDELLAALDELEARVVAELDPATRRVISLARSDLVELRDR